MASNIRQELGPTPQCNFLRDRAPSFKEAVTCLNSRRSAGNQVGIHHHWWLFPPNTVHLGLHFCPLLRLPNLALSSGRGHPCFPFRANVTLNNAPLEPRPFPTIHCREANFTSHINKVKLPWHANGKALASSKQGLWFLFDGVDATTLGRVPVKLGYLHRALTVGERILNPLAS